MFIKVILRETNDHDWLYREMNNNRTMARKVVQVAFVAPLSPGVVASVGPGVFALVVVVVVPTVGSLRCKKLI